MNARIVGATVLGIAGTIGAGIAISRAGGDDAGASDYVAAPRSTGAQESGGSEAASQARDGASASGSARTSGTGTGGVIEVELDPVPVEDATPGAPEEPGGPAPTGHQYPERNVQAWGGRPADEVVEGIFDDYDRDGKEVDGEKRLEYGGSAGMSEAFRTGSAMGGSIHNPVPVVHTYTIEHLLRTADLVSDHKIDGYATEDDIRSVVLSHDATADGMLNEGWEKGGFDRIFGEEKVRTQASGGGPIEVILTPEPVETGRGGIAPRDIAGPQVPSPPKSTAADTPIGRMVDQLVDKYDTDGKVVGGERQLSYGVGGQPDESTRTGTGLGGSPHSPVRETQTWTIDPLLRVADLVDHRIDGYATEADLRSVAHAYDATADSEINPGWESLVYNRLFHEEMTSRSRSE